MTSKQLAFIAAYLAVRDAEQAAIQAGYSANGSRKAGWRLLQHPEVAAELERRSRPPAPAADLTPVEYLLQVMNDPEAPMARRIRAAISVAPFVHTRKADVGKKEAGRAAARAVTGKYEPRKPPPNVVTFKRSTE